MYSLSCVVAKLSLLETPRFVLYVGYKVLSAPRCAKNNAFISCDRKQKKSGEPRASPTRANGIRGAPGRSTAVVLRSIREGLSRPGEQATYIPGNPETGAKRNPLACSLHSNETQNANQGSSKHQPGVPRIFFDGAGEGRQRRSRAYPGLLSRRSAPSPRRFRLLHPPFPGRCLSIYLYSSCAMIIRGDAVDLSTLKGESEDRTLSAEWQKAAIAAARRSYLHMTFPFPQGKALPTLPPCL